MFYYLVVQCQRIWFPRKISILLPEHLLKIIGKNVKNVGLGRSEYITRILEDKLGTVEESQIYLTVFMEA